MVPATGGSSSLSNLPFHVPHNNTGGTLLPESPMGSHPVPLRVVELTLTLFDSIGFVLHNLYIYIYILPSESKRRVAKGEVRGREGEGVGDKFFSSRKSPYLI